MYLTLYLSLSLCLYISDHLSICLTVSLYLSVSLSICLSYMPSPLSSAHSRAVHPRPLSPHHLTYLSFPSSLMSLAGGFTAFTLLQAMLRLSVSSTRALTTTLPPVSRIPTRYSISALFRLHDACGVFTVCTRIYLYPLFSARCTFTGPL